MTTNPERLWVVCGTTTHGSFFVMARTCALEAREEAALFADTVGSMLPVAEYVRADVAAEQTAAALRGEAHEVAALRAEVEALRAKVDAAARTVLSELRALLVKEAKHAKCIAEDERADGIGIAIDTIDKAALAAKGVG